MSSVCISRCLKDARDPSAPVVRATYVNLYKWPESDAEFVRSVSSNSRGGGIVCGCPPRVVDSISCRQMYLRSYPFSREEDRRRPPPYVARCFGQAREKVRSVQKHVLEASATPREEKRRRGRGRGRGQGRRGTRCTGLGRVKEISWGAMFRIFHSLLSCSASVDVVD